MSHSVSILPSNPIRTVKRIDLEDYLLTPLCKRSSNSKEGISNNGNLNQANAVNLVNRDQQASKILCISISSKKIRSHGSKRCKNTNKLCLKKFNKNSVIQHSRWCSKIRKISQKRCEKIKDIVKTYILVVLWMFNCLQKKEGKEADLYFL